MNDVYLNPVTPLVQNGDGTSSPVGSAKPLYTADMARVITNVGFTTLTRPANATTYTAGDSISNDAVAANVIPLVAALSDLNDQPLALASVRVNTSDTGLGGKRIRAYIYNSDPTANSGVKAGDNAAFSNNRMNLQGTYTGTMTLMADGAIGQLAPEIDGVSGGEPYLLMSPGTGGTSLWIQFQAIDAFTPSGNSTTISAFGKGLQLRA